MAELPRYRGVTAQVQSGAKAHMAQVRSIDSFIQGIKGVERGATDMLATQSIEQAKVDAQAAFTSEGKNKDITDSMSVYGQQYRQSLQNLHKKKMSIDTTKKFNDLYTANKDNPALFEEVTNAYRDEALKDMPEYQKADFVIDYEANKAQFGARVKENRINADKEKAYATGVEFHTQKVEKLSQAFRDGSYERGIAEASMAKENIQDLADSGLIKKSKAVEMLNAIDKKITWSNFKGINDRYINDGDLEGAQKAIEKFRNTNVPGIDDMGREQLADSMQADLNVAIKRTKAEASATDKQLKEDSKININDAIKIYKSGKIPEIENIDMSYQNVDKRLQHEYDVHKKAYEESKNFSTESLQAQQAIINSMKADKGANRTDKEVLDVMESNLKEKFALSKKDPMALGAQEGLYDQTFETTPELGMEALSKVLPDRVKNRAVNIEHFGRGASALFTETEAQAWSDWLVSPATSEKEIHDFLYTIEKNTQGNSGSVYSQLVKKGAGVVAMAGSMIKEGKDQVGMNILRGQKTLPSIDPTLVTEMKETLRGQLDNVFSKNPDGLEPTLSAGLALYANEVTTKGTFDKGATNSDMKKLVNDLTNGVHKRNGQSFFLPKGKTADDVEEWIDDLTPTMMDDVAGMSKEEAVKVVQNGRLVSVGPGAYMVYMRNSNSVLKNPDGKTTYVLRIK